MGKYLNIHKKIKGFIMRHYEKFIITIFLSLFLGYFIEYKHSFKLNSMLDIILVVITSVSLFAIIKIVSLDMKFSKQKSTPRIKELSKRTLFSLTVFLITSILTLILVNVFKFVLPFILRHEIDMNIAALILSIILISFIVFYKDYWLYRKIKNFWGLKNST